MGLQELRKEIEKTAEKKAEEAILEAKAKASGIEKEAREKLQDYKKSKRSEIESLMEKDERMAQSRAGSIAKKAQLLKKKEVIDAVFQKAIDEISSMPKAKRKQTIEKLISKAKAEIGVHTIYCRKEDMDLIDAPDVRQAEIKGGIIAESKDKKLRIDYSFDALMSTVKDKNLHKIASILFDDARAKT